MIGIVVQIMGGAHTWHNTCLGFRHQIPLGRAIPRRAIFSQALLTNVECQSFSI
jgi:hypothetical protein